VSSDFASSDFRADHVIDFKAPAAIDKALVVAQSDSDVKIALTGSGLAGLTPVVPPAGDVTTSSASETGLVVTIKRPALKNVKQIVFQSPAGDLLLVAAPDLSGGGPKLTPHTPIKAGAKIKLIVTGSGLDDLDHVQDEAGNKITVLAFDKKSITLDLPAAELKPGTLSLVFSFKKADDITYPIEVFDSKVDLPKTPAPAPAGK
jgi:hypothetical protein